MPTPSPQDSTSPDEGPLESELPGWSTPTPGLADRQDPPDLMTPDLEPPRTDPREGKKAGKGDDRRAPRGPNSRTPTTGSPRVSTAEEREDAKAKLSAILGAGFELGGVTLHERFTPGPSDCWIPMPGERDLVAGSLASIMVRHMPAVGVAGAASDVGDAITAGVGLILFAVNNSMRTWRLRQGIAEPERGTAPDYTPTPEEAFARDVVLAAEGDADAQARVAAARGEAGPPAEDPFEALYRGE